MNYINVTTFKNEYPDYDVSSYTDTTLSGLIDKASARVDDYLEYSPLVADVSNEKTKTQVTAEGDLIVFTRKRPINSVSSLKIVKGTEEVDIDLQDDDGNNIYDIPEPKNKIVIATSEITYSTVSIINFATLRGKNTFVEASYNAGYNYSEMPAPIEDAAALYLMDIISRRSNPSGAKKVSQGGVTIEYETGSRGKSELVRDAEELLKPYKKFSGF